MHIVLLAISPLFIQHHFPASSLPIRKMQKAFPPIDNRLIEWQAALKQDLQQLFRAGSTVTIGGLAFCMLAGGHAAHQAVYFQLQSLTYYFLKYMMFHYSVCDFQRFKNHVEVK